MEPSFGVGDFAVPRSSPLELAVVEQANMGAMKRQKHEIESMAQDLLAGKLTLDAFRRGARASRARRTWAT